MAKRKNMVSRQAEDGSFEILVDDEKGSSSSSNTPGGKKKGKGPIGIGVFLAILLALGATMALSGGGDEERGVELGPMKEVPGFQPYVAQDAPQESEEELLGALQPSEDAEEEERPFRPRIVEEGYQGEDLWELRDVSVQDRKPDGVETFRDTRGTPISRREAETRMERELDSIRNAEHHFESRLRRREAILNSRVLQPSGPGGGELAPGMEIDENLRRRIQDEFRAQPRPTRFLQGASEAPSEGDGVIFEYDEIPDSWRGDDSGDFGGDFEE